MVGISFLRPFQFHWGGPKGFRLLLSALIQLVTPCLVAFCPVMMEALEGELTLCA